MADSVYKSILDAVGSELRSLNLFGITDQNIKVMKVPSDREDDLPGYPGIIVAPQGSVTNDTSGGTNIRDEIGYPVAIYTLQISNQDQDEEFDRFLNYHRLIRRHFINQRLTGVTEVNRTTSTPKDTFDAPAWFSSNLDVSATVLRFWAWETRG